MLPLILELVFDIILIGVCGLFFGVSNTFKSAKPVSGDILAADGFPKIIIIITAILLLWEVYRVVRKIIDLKKSESLNNADVKSDEKVENAASAKGYKRLFICIAIIAAYIFLMQKLGYILSTFLFAFTFAEAIGYRKHVKLLIISIVITAVLLVVFGMLFSISLPRGIGFLKEISYYIY